MYIQIKDITTFVLAIYAVLWVVASVILRKIIFNISKNDLLATIGMLMYVFIPFTAEKVTLFGIILLNIFILLAILYLQKLIDELKQLGIKTNKYLKLSIFLGILIGVTNVIGFNLNIWILTIISLLFVTANLDKTHINFSNKIISMFRKKRKEFLYVIERVNISKMMISIVVVLIFAYISQITFNFVVQKIADKNILSNNAILADYVDKNMVNKDMTSNNAGIKNTISKNNTFQVANVMQYISQNLIEILINFKGFHLVICMYIIFIEILTVVLHRRYDTKTTILKLFFVFTLILAITLGMSQVIYAQILVTLLVIIAVVNTSNLYLNRDERIKLLTA